MPARRCPKACGSDWKAWLGAFGSDQSGLPRLGGATETSPANTSVYWPIERAGCIGGPLPGVDLKFVPNAGKLELRVRGPNVFAGYRNAPALTAKAFDDEGYYLIGDAGRLVDDARPELGVAFDGRVAEDFKLMSGTWVSVGTLRVRAVTALTPLASDVVITGHDREEVGVLIFPSPAAKALSQDDLGERIRAALVSMRHDGGGGRPNRPCAPVCWTSRPASTRARSPTRATSIKARSSGAATRT